MNDIDKLRYFDLLIQNKNDIKSLIFLNLLRSTHNLNDEDLCKLISLINDIDDDRILNSIRIVLSNKAILRNGLSLEISKILSISKEKKNSDAIIDLLKNKIISNNKNVTMLCRILNKDISRDLLNLSIETAKRLSFVSNNNIVEITDIISNSTNYDVGVFAYLVVINDYGLNMDDVRDFTFIISKSIGREQAFNAHKTFNLLENIDNININELKNIIRIISNTKDKDVSSYTYNFISLYYNNIDRFNNINPLDEVRTISNSKNSDMAKEMYLNYLSRCNNSGYSLKKSKDNKRVV